MNTNVKDDLALMAGDAHILAEQISAALDRVPEVVERVDRHHTRNTRDMARGAYMIVRQAASQLDELLTLLQSE
jgi:hypothetical protein